MNSAERAKGNDMIWNLMTMLLLSGVVIISIVVAVILKDPNSAINPFPPPLLPTALAFSVTETPSRQLPATWTPTVYFSPTPTQEATPTPPTPLVTVTVIQEGSQPEPAPTETTVSYAYTLKSEVVPLAGTIFHPDWECSWLGVAGQVEDLQGRPAKGIRVVVGGSASGSILDLNSLTGTALQYGPAGFEFKLADAPYASSHSLWIQLLDQSGLPLSKKTYFDTFSDCKKNLLLINFKQVR